MSSAAQYDKIVKIVEEKIPSRADKILAMYEYFKPRMLVAPASGKINFHNCYEGGYIDHVLNVVKAAEYQHFISTKMGMVPNYTNEELIFSALHHDLGKVGDLDEPYYLPQTSEWHRDRGEYYVHNPNLHYMTVTDRALFLLQHFDIKISYNEFYGIKLSDGMYDEANKSYLKGYGPSYPKTDLHRIIHWADHMATVSEKHILEKLSQEN